MDKDSDTQEFNAAYEAYAAGIFRFIYIRVSEYEPARDLTSDTFVRFWKRVRERVEIANPKALLYIIARGLIIDHYRRRYKQSVSLEDVDERLLARTDGTADRMALRQEVDAVLRSMQNIKKEYREVLLLHYVEDFTVTEIAEIVGKKQNAVRVLLHRALASLRKVI